ncbi:MAG: Cys-tRNA(Pro) deacylase [Burkholderiales bacterium]
MSREKAPVTTAVRELRAHGVAFTNHLYTYEEHGGTAVSARELGVPEHAVVKTLVLEDQDRNPLIVLMHGDMKVSTRELARIIGVKSIAPSTPETANRHTGYVIGGTSPFGTRRKLSVYMESSILDLERIYINGGKRGYLVGMAPQDVVRVLAPTLVEVGIPD